MCLDVAVMRGAECHTNHQLLCVRVRVPGKGFKHKTPAKAKTKRFDLAKLAERRGEDNCKCTPRERFQDETVKEAQAAWPLDSSVTEKWKVIRSAPTKVAECSCQRAEAPTRLVPREQDYHTACSQNTGTACTHNGLPLVMQEFCRSSEVPMQKLARLFVQLRMHDSRPRLKRQKGRAERNVEVYPGYAVWATGTVTN